MIDEKGKIVIRKHGHKHDLMSIIQIFLLVTTLADASKEPYAVLFTWYCDTLGRQRGYSRAAPVAF